MNSYSRSYGLGIMFVLGVFVSFRVGEGEGEAEEREEGPSFVTWVDPRKGVIGEIGIIFPPINRDVLFVLSFKNGRSEFPF